MSAERAAGPRPVSALIRMGSERLCQLCRLPLCDVPDDRVRPRRLSPPGGVWLRMTASAFAAACRAAQVRGTHSIVGLGARPRPRARRQASSHGTRISRPGRRARCAADAADQAVPKPAAMTRNPSPIVTGIGNLDCSSQFRIHAITAASSCGRGGYGMVEPGHAHRPPRRRSRARR